MAVDLTGDDCPHLSHLLDKKHLHCDPAQFRIDDKICLNFTTELYLFKNQNLVDSVPQILKLMSDENTNFPIEEETDGPVKQVSTDSGIDGAQWIVE